MIGQRFPLHRSIGWSGWLIKRNFSSFVSTVELGLSFNNRIMFFRFSFCIFFTTISALTVTVGCTSIAVSIATCGISVFKQGWIGEIVRALVQIMAPESVDLAGEGLASGIGIPAIDMRVLISGSLGRCPREQARAKI